MASLVLVVAAILPITRVSQDTTKTKARGRLAELLPRELSGWKVTDEPLGTTEAINQAVLRTLNLDDYVYRRFTKGAATFTVYAAYWAPGRMPTRLVATHTPDRCWTENGMQCVDMRFRQVYGVNGRNLLPAEFRVFSPLGTAERTLVVYWHTVDGKLYNYGERFNAIPDPWLWWKDVVSQATHGSREQLFVRLASSSPLEQLWMDPDFLTVMKTVADLGLWQSD